MDLLIPGELLKQEFQSQLKKIQILEKELQEIQEALCPNQQNIQNDFIGAHPVTLTLQNLQTICRERNDFLLCEKTDGVRYLLIILSNGQCFFTGRQMGNQREVTKQYFLSDIILPQYFQITKEFDENLFINYLFDGELVIDKYVNKQKTKYLIFDTIIFEKNYVGNRTYLDRLQQAKNFLNFYRTVKNIQPTVKSQNNIKLVLKDFFKVDIVNISYIYNNYRFALAHKNDGLIFSRNSSPYISGKNENFIKWKPSNLNSIDFLLVPNKKFKTLFDKQFNDSIIDLYVNQWVKGEQQRLFFDYMTVDNTTYNDIQQQIATLYEQNQGMAIFGVIGECTFDFEQQQNFIQQIYEQQSNQEQTIKDILKFPMYKQQDNIKQNELFQESLNYYIENNFKGGWKLHNYRLDKSQPNAFKTAINIRQSIYQNIDLDKLIGNFSIKNENLGNKIVKLK